MNFNSPEEAKLTIILFLSMLMSAVLIACKSHAYIPNSQFVFTRLTSLHGKGAYVIEDEVTFHERNDSVVLRENWIIIDGGEMRLSVQGEGTRIFRILKKGRLFWVDDGGSERSREVPPGHVMRYLMTRSPIEEKKIFMSWGILPSEVMREKKLPKDVKDIQVSSESFARLSRATGAVTIAYGTASPQDGTPLPGLWVEQDQFVIRKARSPDGSESILSDYGTFSKGLTFPRTQVLNFDTHSVNVKTIRIAATDLSSDSRRQFDLNWLRGKPDARTVYSNNPNLGPVIQEFYKRFR